jgi:DNA polymerase-3 subunit epsilon
VSADVRTLEKPWQDFTYVALDTETSGQYPIADEIVEIAMVKWKGCKEVDSFQTLIKPKKPMGEAVIKIHGITNEMVVEAPPIETKINEILKFIEGSVIVAHHAPFDVGFLAWEFEKAGKSLPNEAVVCSSLLSRAVVQSPTNHKLQTMISLLGLTQTQAHRADSDARACWQLALHCMNKVGVNATLKEVVKTQKRTLWWQDYSLKALEQNQRWRGIIEAVHLDKSVEFIYDSGSHKGKPRKAKPLGIVRNPDGDYFPAFCDIDKAVKRFYLNKIAESLVCN